MIDTANKINGLLTPGTLVEIHTSEDYPHTLSRYFLHTPNKLICYFDLSGGCYSDKEDSGKVWYIFDAAVLDDIFCMAKLAKAFNVIVIDDITLYEGDIWKLLKRLAHMTKDYGLCVVVLNQRRNVLNHATGEYEDKPYRYNAIQRYCDCALDLTTGEVQEFKPQVEYDDFVQGLIGKVG